MERYEEIEKSITTVYRKKIWSKFIKGIKEFDMVQEGDKIAVCISGGKDSMLLAKCMQELKKHRQVNFDLVFLVMDPGYNPINRQKIINNAKLLNIPITIFESNIFKAVEKIDDHPCYICARMRRGYLYRKAQELGCNKIALGHHFDDVIETILMGMLYGAQMQTMMPKLHSTFHEGMQLIRPLYYVKEADIIRWKERNDLHKLPDRLCCHGGKNGRRLYSDGKHLPERRKIRNIRADAPDENAHDDRQSRKQGRCISARKDECAHIKGKTF